MCHSRPGVDDLDEFGFLGEVGDDGESLDQVRHRDDQVTLKERTSILTTNIFIFLKIAELLPQEMRKAKRSDGLLSFLNHSSNFSPKKTPYKDFN